MGSGAGGAGGGGGGTAPPVGTVEGFGMILSFSAALGPADTLTASAESKRKEI